MEDLEEFERQLKEADNIMDDAERGMLHVLDKSVRATEYVYKAPERISKLALDFKEKTKLTDVDIEIMFVAIGLQIIRQFLQEKLALPEERVDDQTAAGKHEYSDEERNKGYYNPSMEEILFKPVPFDVIDGADGAFKGSGFFGHRGKTVGHDPLLGLIVGTANIATATVTITHGMFNYESYHVRTNFRNRDGFAEHADNAKVIKRTIDKVLHNTGGDGRARVAAALAKEIIHLKSDVYSKKSLPLPILTSISPELAGWLAEHGVDCANVLYVGQQLKTIGKQAMYSVLINYIISLFHGLFYNGNSDKERKLYEVRTRKILTYSNLVATAFNLGKCGLEAFNGDYKKAFEDLDLGGLCVTVYRVITDTEFINQVRHEFVIGEFEKEFQDIINA